MKEGASFQCTESPLKSTQPLDTGHMLRSKLAAFEKSLKENWIVIGSLLTLFGGMATFLYKEWYVPKTAPINISVDLGLEVDPRSKDDQLVLDGSVQALPIKLKVTAENKSFYGKLLLLDPIWVAYGYMIVPIEGAKKTLSTKEIVDRINRQFAVDSISRPLAIRTTPYQISKEIIGAGKIFGNSEIRPNEIIKGDRIIAIPKSTYDFVQVRVYIPSLKFDGPKAKAFRTELSLTQDTNDLSLLFCHPLDPKILKHQDCESLSLEEQAKIGAQISVSASEIWLDNERMGS